MKQKVIDLNLPDNDVAENKDENMRLQVYLAHCGIASRRNAEYIIKDGRVTVNGVLKTEMGTKVSPTDTVCVDGKKISLETSLRYVLLHKPSGYVCSLSDEKGRPVAADLLKETYKERLYNVGRLDMYSSGAILFTNDGQFASHVGHPSSEIEKEYIVEANMPFKDEVITAFSKGLRIESVYYRCKEIERMSSRRLRVVLVEGKNREIRRVLEHFQIRIKNLIRIRIGSVEMKNLLPGEFRNLSVAEVQSLLKSTLEEKNDNSN